MNSIKTWWAGFKPEVTSFGRDLLALNPPDEWKFMWVYAGFLGICLVGGILINFLRIHPSLKSRFSLFFWTNVSIGIFLFFFRYEGIPLFGMDIWHGLQEIIAVVWLFNIFRYSKSGLRNEKLTEKAEAYKKKYLPKK